MMPTNFIDDSLIGGHHDNKVVIMATVGSYCSRLLDY